MPENSLRKFKYDLSNTNNMNTEIKIEKISLWFIGILFLIIGTAFLLNVGKFLSRQDFVLSVTILLLFVTPLFMELALIVLLVIKFRESKELTRKWKKENRSVFYKIFIVFISLFTFCFLSLISLGIILTSVDCVPEGINRLIYPNELRKNHIGLMSCEKIQKLLPEGLIWF